MSDNQPVLGIIGGGQLGSMLCMSAKKINIDTVILSDDEAAPAQNFCNKFINCEYSNYGKIKDFLGNYNDYRFKNQEIASVKKTTGKKEKTKVVIETKAPEKQKTKFSYKEKLEFESLEKDLATLELKKTELTEQLNNVGTDHDQLMKVTKEIGDITLELDTKTDRWLTLSEYA